MQRIKGFTLVELLVVMSIVALLIAILLPSLRQSMVVAKALKCQVNLKGLCLAQNTYINDHVYFPCAGGIAVSGSPLSPDTSGTNNISWDDLLGNLGYDGRSLASNYMNGASPGVIRYIAGNPTFQPGDLTILRTLYHCPSYISPLDTANSQFFARTYAMNDGGIVDMRNGAGTNPAGYKFLRGISYNTWSKRSEDIPNPSGTILMVEGDQGGGNTMGSVSNASYGTPYNQQGYSLTPLVLPFHENKWNYGFVDGHVSLLSPHVTYGTGNYGGPSYDLVWPVGTSVTVRGSCGMWTADPND